MERLLEMTTELILKNARIVLEDVIIEGALVIRDGNIVEIAEGGTSAGEDMGGDYLIPGLVELHTDHLEGHYSPRPGVAWNMTAAIQAHDAQVASSGMTTVFDCVRIGSDEDGGYAGEEMQRLAGAIKAAKDDDRLRADHLIHLRCEVSAGDVLEHFDLLKGNALVSLISLMDHAPGQRQFQTLDQYALYYKAKKGFSDAAFEAFSRKRQEASARHSGPNRNALADHARERGIAIASHDDATLDHVKESIGFDVRIAEFPTSIDAARASHEAGMAVLMGAPNVVRGGSHSGNIAAGELAHEQLLDVLSSDYIPLSLIHAPFVLADTIDAISLPRAIAMVTANPADAVGLTDRGRIKPGLRADLARIRHNEGVPVVRTVWREGARVA